MRLVVSALLLASAPILSAAGPRPAQSAPAAEPAPPSVEQLQLARRFVSLTVRADDMVEMMSKGMAYTATAKLNEDVEDAEQKVEAEKDLKRILVLLEPKFRQRVGNLLEAYSVVYARDYSAEDLQQMIGFAQTPAGQHYFSQALAVQTDPIVERQMEGFQNDLWPVMDEFRKEKCAARAAQRVAMGDKKARCPLSAAQDTAAG